MRTFTKSISMLLAIFFMVANLSSAQTPNSKPAGGKLDIDTFIAGQMEAFHVPGLSACIIVGDEVVWNNNYGYMNLEDSIPVNDNTLFNAFSIGKSLTAVCVMQQWENGNLDIDGDVSNYLPFEVINPNFPDVNLTSRMLLCHSSSLTDMNMETYGTEGDPTESLAFFCENYFPAGGSYYNIGNYYGQTPGNAFHYSNLGVGLNGYIVESITGTEFHSYADENLLSPLNMEQSAWFLDELNLDNLAIGYDYASGSYTPNVHMGHPCYPGLMLRSTALELSQFAIMLLNEGQYQGNEILQSSTVNTMLTVQNPNWGFSYGTTGLGLFKRTDYGNRTVWGHNGGSSRGYAAHLYFCNNENTGIVIMTNSNQYVDPIVEYMFDYAYELANPPNTSQIQFVGYVSQGEGIAGWNADGSGPEPAATGHQVPAPGFTNQYYYGSSHDYITGNPNDACFHFTSGMTGFPQFEQALADHAFTPEQVKCKYGLISLRDDVEGMDWFFMNNWAYSNYYDINFVFELDGEPILSGYMDWANMYINTNGGNWEVESSYVPLTNIATPNTVHFDVAQAFLNDLDGKEIKTYYQATNGYTPISGEGRSGAFYNVINGLLTVGNPSLPFQGLYNDHEGFASWDANGTGPEPSGDGHQNQKYYQASADYDGIDPDSDACLAHFTEGSSGFFNTLLQLEYRGFEIGDLKMKQGLSSLGLDVYGEDWGYENQQHWVHYYNNGITIELNGEPVLYMMADTNRQLAEVGYWLCNTSFTPVYNISDNASAEAQFVAQSFLKDLGDHYLRPGSTEIIPVAGSNFNENGRSGSRWEIYAGSIKGIHAKATFIPEGPVSGTWTAENSPYYVDGHLTVENGETLTIEPGVKVAVRGPYHFDVQGCVKAEGTADENIVFTRSNPNLWWDGFDYFETPAGNQASVFNHCLFEYGYGLGTGQGRNSGGMFAIKQFDSVLISNSTFRYNKVDRNGYYPPSGGAIGIWDADIFVSKCIFYENEAEYGGAFFSYENAEPVVSNCLFYNNHAYYGGAITMYEYCNGVFINNTIADNTANYGGAFYFYYLSNAEIINSILWDNEATIGDQVYSSTSAVSHPGFYYCDIEGGQAGFGGSQINGDYLFNIEDDPMFSGDEVYPYSLLNNNSPCWNAGTPDTSALFIAYNQYLPETCLCDSTRIADGCIEIGAYEYPLSVGVNEHILSSNEAFSTYPNPFHQNLTISFELDNAAMVCIEIYNVVGEKVEVVSNTNMPAGKHSLNQSIPSLPEGIYFCRMQVGDEVFTQKIVKQ